MKIINVVQKYSPHGEPAEDLRLAANVRTNMWKYIQRETFSFDGICYVTDYKCNEVIQTLQNIHQRLCEQLKNPAAYTFKAYAIEIAWAPSFVKRTGILRALLADAEKNIADVQAAVSTRHYGIRTEDKLHRAALELDMICNSHEWETLADKVLIDRGGKTIAESIEGLCEHMRAKVEDIYVELNL